MKNPVTAKWKLPFQSVKRDKKTAETRTPIKPSLALRLLLGAVTGLALALSFPPFSVVFLLPVALASLLWLLQDLTPRLAYYVGLVAGLCWFATSLFWLADMFGRAAIALWALAAFFPALFCGLFTSLHRRLPRIPVWLLAAVVWTGIEYFRSEWMQPAFAWLGIGYAVVDVPWLASLASLAGSYGLSFVLVAFGVLLLNLAQQKETRGKAILVLLFWGILLFLPRPTPTPENALQIRLVQASSEDDEDLFGKSVVPGATAPDLILWPEYSFISDPTKQPKLWKRLTELPQRQHCYFLFGAKAEGSSEDAADFRNTAFLLSPEGREIARHVKNHTIPFFRDGIAGTDARAVTTPLGRLGIAICFDLDFPDVTRRLVEDGAEILLVPSNNPAEWGSVQRVQHRQMFAMRAIECGRWIATSDVAGNTEVLAPTGAEVRRVPSQQSTTLQEAVGRKSNRTLFVRFGWRFGSLCLLLLVVCMVLPLIRKPTLP